MCEVAARDVLTDFLSTMWKWESENFKLLSDALENDNVKLARTIKSTAKEALENIFEKFCVPGKGDRRRLISTSLKSPTTYDPERDDLESSTITSNGLVFVYRQTNGLETTIRFTMRKSGDEWRINKAEYYSVLDSKWLAWTL